MMVGVVIACSKVAMDFFVGYISDKASGRRVGEGISEVSVTENDSKNRISSVKLYEIVIQ